MKALQRRLEDELTSCLQQIQTARTLEHPEQVEGAMNADMVDRIQATGMVRNQAAVASRAVTRAAAIRAALERVREGRYGECVQCGEPISAARLRIVPEAATCVGCQERLERTVNRRVA